VAGGGVAGAWATAGAVATGVVGTTLSRFRGVVGAIRGTFSAGWTGVLGLDGELLAEDLRFLCLRFLADPEDGEGFSLFSPSVGATGSEGVLDGVVGAAVVLRFTGVKGRRGVVGFLGVSNFFGVGVD
jgi:hypothetical protein